MKFSEMFLLVPVMLFFSSYPASAFTIISGPAEATLPVTPTEPEITFYWDGSHPPISEKDDIDDGRYANVDDEELMLILIQEAFDEWNNVKGSYLRMKVERADDLKVDPNDGRYVIVSKKSNNAAAKASALPIVNKSTIEDCDIQIGSKKATAKDLRYSIAHEVGHCLGLGHNHTNRRAIMGYTREDINLWLSNDDKAGIIYLYMDPAFDGERKEFLGCATIANPKRASLFVALLVLSLPVVFVLTRRRRRNCCSK